MLDAGCGTRRVVHFADFGKVGEGRLLGADLDDLRWSHGEAFLLAGHQLGVLFAHDVEHPREQLVVRVVALGRPRHTVFVCRHNRKITGSGRANHS